MVVNLSTEKSVRKLRDANHPETPGPNHTGVSAQSEDDHDNADLPPMLLGRVSISQLVHRPEGIYET